MATRNAANADTIVDGESYTLREFQRRTHLGNWALRTARRRGLKVCRVGGRAYISGRDWMDYLSEHAANQSREQAASTAS